MQHLFDDTKYHDIRFKLDDGTVFGGHRVVLYHSKVQWFKTMLSGDFREATDSTVQVREVESHVFEIALKYAYGITPFLEKFSFEKQNVMPIFQAASHFVCHDLVFDLHNKWLPETSSSIILQGPVAKKVLCFVDCGLQFGGEFHYIISEFRLRIMDISNYFLHDYGYEGDLPKSAALIREAYSISKLNHDDILSYLKMPKIVDGMDLELAEIFLPKIDYVRGSCTDRIDFIRILTKLGNKQLIPLTEIIHLTLYEIPIIIEKYPLKVARAIPSVGFKIHVPEDRGEFLFGWNTKDGRKLENAVLGKLNSDHHFYVFYEGD